MLSGAPPMFVVGLLVQIAMLAIYFLVTVVFDRSLYGEMDTVLRFGSQFVIHLMVGFGMLELARRTRGRQRIATLIAGGAQLLQLAVALAIMGITARMRMEVGGGFDSERYWYELMFSLEQWVVPALAVFTVATFVVALDTRALWIGVLAVATTVLLSPIPPMIKALLNLYRGVGVLGWVGLLGVQIVLMIIVAARIARRALPPQRDHARAARGFGLAIVAVALHAVFEIAMIAWAELGAERFVVGSIAICGLDLLALAVLIRGTWLVAQAQHPSLPRFMVHVALACALATLFGLVSVLLDWYALFHGELYAFVPPWWIELGGTLTLGWMFVVLGRYARRTREIAPPVVLCAGAFTLFACIGVAFHADEIVTAVCLLLANLAAIPALLAARKAIAADPVKTTADVFA